MNRRQVADQKGRWAVIVASLLVSASLAGCDSDGGGGAKPPAARTAPADLAPEPTSKGGKASVDTRSRRELQKERAAARGKPE